MWSNGRSFFLVVRFKQRKKVGLVIPLALPVLEVTLSSWRDSLEVWENVFPRLFAKLSPKRSKNTGNQWRISQLFSWCIRLLNELCQHGAIEFINIDNGENRISIRLW